MPAKLVRSHAQLHITTARAMPGAAVAEREPRRARAPARAAAADRRRLDLEPQARDDALGRRLLERGRALDRDAADSRVLEREPAEDARLAARLLRVLERRVAQAGGVEEERQVRPRDAIAGDRERERREQLEVVLVHRRVDELPRVLERKAAPALAQPALHGVEPQRGSAGATRPRASSRTPTRAARRGATRRARRRGRAGRRRRDRRAAGGSAPRRRPGSRGGRRRQRHVRLERGLDEPRGRPTPQPSPASTPTWPRSTRPKRPARPAIWASSQGRRSRRDLAVELRRLGEEQRLAREVDAVPEDVGRDADVGRAGQEAVDLLAPRRERHRAVEHGDPARVQPVHLAREREHGLAAERDDDRARCRASGACARRRTRAAASARRP